MADIDYLNDPLLATPNEKPKAASTPLIERAVETLERIEAFVAETGTEPRSEPSVSVQERMLANELAGLRASRADLAELKAYDHAGIVFDNQPAADPLSDPLLDDGLGIFTVRDELKPIARPDYVADRRPCADFERFEPLFQRVRESVENGERKPQRFHQERVELGEFFVLKGQLVYVADIRGVPKENGKSDARLRVIFGNETESDLLMTSLVRRLYEDKDAQRLGSLTVGPLFDGAHTGFVYVLRSLSEKEGAQGLLKVGTTSGAVEDRIARAETQSAFLFAPVEIVATFALKGHSAREVEQRLHRALKDFNVPIKVIGPDGRSFTATEWFKVTVEMVERVVAKSLSVGRR